MRGGTAMPAVPRYSEWVMVDYVTARRNMVESQVRPNKVTDRRLIGAMAEIPRELFLPEPLRSIAYVDEDIALGGGRVLMAPMVLARLLQAANVRPTDIVLDIGCATGYSTAILARLCDTVVGIESDPEMAAAAGAVLAESGVDNAAVIEGPLADGYAKQAPYGVILFGGAIEAVPDAIVRQLADDGRLVAVVVDRTGVDRTGVDLTGAGRPGVGRATLMTRSGPGTLSGRPVFDAATALLPGVGRGPAFVF